MTSALPRCLGIAPAVARVSHNFLRLLGHGRTFINVCGYHPLCSSESQDDFRLRRLNSLLDFLVCSLITEDPNMVKDPL
ncbi:hypothetical protein TNCV_4049321 [Trichonephila clavipes]|nr:hypothetical protein TNCV_4049321 [Trichonephila clavipes]